MPSPSIGAWYNLDSGDGVELGDDAFAVLQVRDIVVHAHWHAVGGAEKMISCMHGCLPKVRKLVQTSTPF